MQGPSIRNFPILNRNLMSKKSNNWCYKRLVQYCATVHMRDGTYFAAKIEECVEVISYDAYW